MIVDIQIERWDDYDIPVITIRIIRNNFENNLTQEQRNGISETSLDNYTFDYTIRSESGLDNLKFEIDKSLNSEIFYND